jgi:hypothetical protein
VSSKSFAQLRATQIRTQLDRNSGWLFGNVVYETAQIAKQRVFDHRTLKSVALPQAVIDALYDVVFGPVDGLDLRPGQNVRQPVMQLRGLPAVSISNIVWSTDVTGVCSL